MSKKVSLAGAVTLLTLLAACGSAPDSSPQPDQTPATGRATMAAVTPYYVGAQTPEVQLFSGSTVVVEDGSRVPEGRLYLQNKQTGMYRLLTTSAQFGEAFYADGGALSADRRTAYTVINAGGDWTLYALDLRSGAANPLLNRTTALQNGLTEAEGKTLVVSPDGSRLAFRGYTIKYDEQLGTVAHTNAMYVVDLGRSVQPQGAPPRLMRVPIQSTTALPYPKFDMQNRLTESSDRTTQLSPNVPGRMSTQDLGIVGRLPIAGTVELTTSFHGSGYAGGSSWGTALDFAPRPYGTTMAARSVASGVVKNVYSSGCGVYVVVDHSTTSADTFYCHLVTGSPGSYSINAGTSLYEGQPLGTIGNTGVSTGVHLHLALIQGDVFGLRGRDPTRTGCNIYSGNWVVGRQYQYLADPC